MESSIVKQVDPSYNDPFVAFVEREARWIKTGTFGEANSGDTFFVTLHRRPINASEPMGFRRCEHKHRSIDAAVRCAKKMLLAERRSPSTET